MVDMQEQDNPEIEDGATDPSEEGMDDPYAGLGAQAFPSLAKELGAAGKQAAPAEEAAAQPAQAAGETESAPAAEPGADETIEINRHRYNVKDVPPEYMALHNANRAQQSTIDQLQATVAQLSAKMDQRLSAPQASAQSAAAPTTGNAASPASVLSKEDLSALEDAGFPADVFNKLVGSAIARGVEERLAQIAPELQGLKSEVQALKPVAMQQQIAELDQRNEQQIAELLSTPDFAHLKTTPKEVLARMRAAQQGFIKRGIPMEQVYNNEYSADAFELAIGALSREQLRKGGTAPAPQPPALKPILPGLPARGAAAPASAQPRSANGQFTRPASGLSANERALRLLD